MTFKQVKIVLDESKFGNTESSNMPLMSFYKVHINDKHEFITARHCDGSTLIAVTKEQFKQWKSYTIISRLAT